MRKIKNSTKIEGRVYEHALALKVTGESSKAPGTPYIGGSIDIATDDAGLNVVTVYFTYVTEFTKSGSKNGTFTALKNIIENGKTVVIDGLENATIVNINSAVAVNDFYTSRNGEEKLVSAKRNEGGFVTIETVGDLGLEKTRSRFETDMLINDFVYVEANEEKNIPADYVVIKGCTFNFRNDMIPVEYIVKDSSGMKYFESLDISKNSPVFTKVKGSIVSQTIVEQKEEASAFGEASVRETTKTIRQWVVDWASPEPYEIGDAENGITAEEVNTAIQNREIHLADVKKRQDEYQATKNAAAATPVATTATITEKSFNF